jgi:hypothetical protein
MLEPQQCGEVYLLMIDDSSISGSEDFRTGNTSLCPACCQDDSDELYDKSSRYAVSGLRLLKDQSIWTSNWAATCLDRLREEVEADSIIGYTWKTSQTWRVGGGPRVQL